MRSRECRSRNAEQAQQSTPTTHTTCIAPSHLRGGLGRGKHRFVYRDHAQRNFARGVRNWIRNSRAGQSNSAYGSELDQGILWSAAEHLRALFPTPLPSPPHRGEGEERVR